MFQACLSKVIKLTETGGGLIGDPAEWQSVIADLLEKVFFRDEEVAQVLLEVLRVCRLGGSRGMIAPGG